MKQEEDGQESMCHGKKQLKVPFLNSGGFIFHQHFLINAYLSFVVRKHGLRKFYVSDLNEVFLGAVPLCNYFFYI